MTSDELDVERFERALRNTYERRYGPLEVDGPIVIFGAMASEIAAEYNRLRPVPEQVGD